MDGDPLGGQDRQGGAGGLRSMLLLLLGEGERSSPMRATGHPTRCTHWHIATMIGANKGASTKAFGELQEGGGVELRNRYVYVTDVEAQVRFRVDGFSGTTLSGRTSEN